MKILQTTVGLLLVVLALGFRWWIGAEPARDLEVSPGARRPVAIAAYTRHEVHSETVTHTGDQESPFPSEFHRKYPPGTRIPMRLPDVRTGISIGAGQFVPPLNGVTVADGIPPIKRDRRLSPPGPVVAKIVDLQGQEWWLHADGSQTSCSFASITRADGSKQRIVSTQHGAPPAGGCHGSVDSR